MSATSIRLGPDRDGLSVVTEGDRITNFGPEPAPEPERDGGDDGPMPCPSSTLGPGRINAHTHIYSGLTPLGMPAPAEKPEVGYPPALMGAIE